VKLAWPAAIKWLKLRKPDKYATEVIFGFAEV